MTVDWEAVPSPCFVCDLGALRKNLERLRQVQEAAGCKILLAQKGFALWSTYPLCREFLAGTTASGYNEARLGFEEFGGETHVYSVAFAAQEFDEIAGIADHVVFNSIAQYERFAPQARLQNCSCGLRINPEHSEVATTLYDPCAPHSRLGVTQAQFDVTRLGDLDGLHFHTLCELDADALERTLAVVEAKFGTVIPSLRWMNFGGGHHITRPGYAIAGLVRIIRDFRSRYPDIEVYLEPGEAIGLNTGVLVSTVLDIVHNETNIAILDVSATAHMPDVLEMPYRPHIRGGGDPGAKAHTYRLGGLTCLAGDVIGDWSFDAPLEVGSRVVFEDMIHYTMVKTTTFNGVHHPAIGLYEPGTGDLRIVRRFTYEDYRGRLS